MLGKSPVTLNAIALHAGVSKMTASAIINGSQSNTRVSATTRERVLAVAHEMGYRPNPIAQALATGQSRTITLWTPTDFGPYLALLAHHVRREARRHGYTLTIWDMPPGKPEAALQPGAFPEWTVAGILVPDGREWVDAYLDQVKAPLPLVSLGGYCSERADYVGVDLKAGTWEALHHLHAAGRRRIAYLVPRRGVLSGDPRYESYQSFMANADLPEERIVASDSLRADAYIALAEHLKQERNPPEGLFCYNDEMAIGANRALREAGLRVPEDVALVGCDGIEEMEYHEPPLSTVLLPLQEMCALAWQCLQNRIANPDASRSQIALPTQLIVRRSSQR